MKRGEFRIVKRLTHFFLFFSLLLFIIKDQHAY